MLRRASRASIQWRGEKRAPPRQCGFEIQLIVNSVSDPEVYSIQESLEVRTIANVEDAGKVRSEVEVFAVNYCAYWLPSDRNREYGRRRGGGDNQIRAFNVILNSTCGRDLSVYKEVVISGPGKGMRTEDNLESSLTRIEHFLDEGTS